MISTKELPCQVNDIVYQVKGYGMDAGVSEWRISRIIITAENIWFHAHGNGTAQIIPIEWFGRTVFTDELTAHEYFKSQTT